MKKLPPSAKELFARLQVVPAPTRSSSGNWWPDLFLRKGRELLQITPEQCHGLMMAAHGSDGARACHDIKLYDIDGEQIGHVSYNGRVWLHDIEGEVEVPVAGRETCASRNARADGWEEFRAGPQQAKILEA